MTDSAKLVKSNKLNKKSKMDNINEILMSTTIHGVPKLIKNQHKLLKLIWLICICMSVCGMGFFLTKSLINYFQYEVITNINVYRDKVAQFPAVTFCIHSTRDTTLDKILISCKFNTLSCNETDFEHYFSDIADEACFRFNSGRNKLKKRVKIRNISRNDPKTGLNIIFFNPFNYQDELVKAFLYIHNHSYYFTRDYVYNIDNGVELPSGRILVSIEREFTEKLGKPYNDCVKPKSYMEMSLYFQRLIKSNMTYSQKDCVDLCVADFMKSNCFISKAAPINRSEIECFEKLYFMFLSGGSVVPEKCFLDCPLECDYIKYDIVPNYIGKITDKHIPGNLTKKMAQMNLTSEDLKKNGVYVSVYFNSLEYKVIYQLPKTQLFDLVSNIGGMTGLFIGTSFLSIVEIFEFLFFLGFNFLKKIKII